MGAITSSWLYQRLCPGTNALVQGEFDEAWNKADPSTQWLTWQNAVRDIRATLSHDACAYIEEEAAIELLSTLLSIGNARGKDVAATRCIVNCRTEDLGTQTLAAIKVPKYGCDIADGMRLLFDLNVGPVRFARSPIRERDGRGHDAERFAPTGLNVEQHVFLDEGNRSQFDTNGQATTSGERPLDTYAQSMARGDASDGVHLLAGGRGAGKSTVLNRIEWFCNNWVSGVNPFAKWSQRGWRPLLVRFDLGTTFNPKKFTLDLMDEICQAVRVHVGTCPTRFSNSPNWIRYVVGHTSRWCTANTLWIFLVSLIGVCLFALSSSGIRLVSDDVAFWPKIAGFVVLPLILFAFTYSIFARWPANWRRWADNSNPYYQLGAFAVVLVIVAITTLWVIPGFGYRPIFANLDSARQAARQIVDAYRGRPSQPSRSQIVPIDPSAKPVSTSGSAPAKPAAIAAAVGDHSAATPAPDPGRDRLADEFDVENLADRLYSERWPADTMLPPEVPPAALHTLLRAGTPLPPPDDRNTLQYWYAVYIAIVSAAAFSVLLLPNWWGTHAYCQTLSTAIRARAGQMTGFDVPYLSGVASLIRAILPQSPANAEISQRDTPFQQQELKVLLRRCANSFNRLVILIDDVDILPSHQFAQFLQLLRPISKVDGVRCVVCVPKYFYFGFLAKVNNDLHSTTQACRLLGDPRFTPKTFPDVEADKDNYVNAVFERVAAIVKPLLASRCVLRFKEPDNSRALNALIVMTWSLWNIDRTPKCAKRVAQVFREELPSRRELLREIERLLELRTSVPFAVFDDLKACERRSFSEERRHYFRSERILTTMRQWKYIKHKATVPPPV